MPKKWTAKLLITPKICLLLIFFAGPVFSEPTAETVLKNMKGREGALLLKLSSEVSNASVELGVIGRSSVKVPLLANSGDYLFLALPRGKYRINSVNIPYFDLPFKLQGGYSGNYWDFEIQARKINFVGELIIKEQRSKENVDVEFINRIASYYADINEHYASYFSEYPLANNRLNQDDFFKLHMRGVENE